ncbi:biotin-dependent carboxyltransferase family protein [Deinococcus navajonensis]|uniref:Biotin-dependent carboxyltransferase family protein n=1 Tax=Deinococcus navajonensis TaxID=309884 RepID=A0ABV8XQG9_9DEIO
MIQVKRPGLQTTVQDAGREARALGVPTGGAADPVALRLANALVGNLPGAAALECTLVGPELHFLNDALVALCGAPFEAQLDGQPFGLGCARQVQAGQTLHLGTTPRGLRTILAVRGGLEGEAAFGSRATDLKSGFGGLAGRALERGDVLRPDLTLPALTPPRARLSPGLLTPLGPLQTLRVLPTPEATPALLRTLVGSPLRVSPQADRMGVRLDTRVEIHVDPGRVSLPNVPGAVQVPPDGRPILLLPDAGTHGGYPAPLVVARVDLPRLGQLRPGDQLHFVLVNAAQAQAALRAREAALHQAATALQWWYNRP